MKGSRSDTQRRKKTAAAQRRKSSIIAAVGGRGRAGWAALTRLEVSAPLKSLTPRTRTPLFLGPLRRRGGSGRAVEP